MSNFSYILERLSTRAKNALASAQKLSEECLHDHIGSEHLLYGIALETSSFAQEVLLKNKLSPARIREKIIGTNQEHITDQWTPRLADDTRAIIEKSALIASRYQYQFIGTEHFLFGIVDSENAGRKILTSLEMNIDELRKNLLSIFENVSRFPDLLSIEDQEKQEQKPISPRKNTPALDYFTTDITRRAQEGKIDPVIGRKKEIERLVAILNRRTKNNPVLIGEPGVGKTAIVEGLALAITNHEVPDALLDKKILALDLALVVAGSMFRGEFENRLKQVIDEVRDNPNIILFIDELHTVVGAGATTGSLDAANILKPALARGELRAIGATTLAEYKKYIEHDAALERRFQPIVVEEPTKAETEAILLGLRSNYEKHHSVTISDEAIKAAVELSARYIQDRRLPDKALDLIDETAARLKTHLGASRALREVRKRESKLAALEEAKTQAVMQQNFPKALELKYEQDRLQQEVETLRKNLEQEKSKKKLGIAAEDIAVTVSSIAHIPATRLQKSEAQKLTSLERILKSRIIGQDEAIRVIAMTIKRSRAMIASQKRPLGSFLFLGPSGVGKTETAKVLAEMIFEDRDALIRVDMSEFMERHNVARLIGAPAGYVGYEEGGRLTEAVRRKPYAVILFDEIEKAHPDVFNILLQILEEGELTDASGKRVSFRNTIIIMTSNIGLRELTQQAKYFGFADANRAERAKAEENYERIKSTVLESLKKTFRPELLNRISKIVVFRPLTAADIQKIVDLQLQQLSLDLEHRHIRLAYGKEIVKHLAQISLDPEQGARLVRKNIQEHIEDLLAEKIIRGMITENDTVKIELHEGKLALEKAKVGIKVAS